MSLALLEKSFYWFLDLFGPHRSIWARAHMAERIAPVYRADAGGGRQLKFHCYGPITYMRAERLLDKEPGTIAWLDSLPEDGVLWDIGANVGPYSLYAALKPGVQVVAVEPEASNHFILTRNISANGFQERVQALNIGISQSTGVTGFYLFTQASGGSEHAIDRPLNHEGDFKPIDKQWVFAMPLDALAQQPGVPFPTHLKIDVDGPEEQVVASGTAVLADPRLVSVQVEISGDAQPITALMNQGGLVLADQHRNNYIFRR